MLGNFRIYFKSLLLFYFFRHVFFLYFLMLFENALVRFSWRIKKDLFLCRGYFRPALN